MQIECMYNEGKEYIKVFVDKSTGNGTLRFSHEILVTFLKKGEELIFNSAWHCGVSEMEWDSSEEDSFEETFPGLLNRMRNEIASTSIAKTEERYYLKVGNCYVALIGIWHKPMMKSDYHKATPFMTKPEAVEEANKRGIKAFKIVRKML